MTYSFLQKDFFLKYFWPIGFWQRIPTAKTLFGIFDISIPFSLSLVQLPKSRINLNFVPAYKLNTITNIPKINSMEILVDKGYVASQHLSSSTSIKISLTGNLLCMLPVNIDVKNQSIFTGKGIQAPKLTGTFLQGK